MSIFQNVLLIVIGGLFVMTIIALARRWATLRDGLLWMTVLTGGTIAVIWPDLTTRIAQVVGIRRGVDLLLYCSLVFMTAGFAMLYVRLRHVRREITLLVRHIAIIEAKEGEA